MNEGTKTGIFWGVAAVIAAFAAIVAWPRGAEETPLSSRVGTILFEEFKDPLTAASMKIVTFDSQLGELESFEVAKDRQTGVWSIPSREGYPADGAEQMQAAATALLDLKVLDVISDIPEDHDDFGVVEPDVEKLAVGDDGVGRLVTIKDDSGKNLVSLVIGNEVEDAESHRYVRVANQDPIYEVELEVSSLTTKFTEWIEEDLLQLSSLDIRGTNIRNYSVSVAAGLQGLSVDQQRSYDANLSLDDTNQWSLDSLVVYDDTNSGSVRQLSDGEVLNTSSLNKMKNALDDLNIVDVVRKPDGMSADLKADKSLVSDNESLQSLVQRGFYPVSSGGEAGVDILSTNGEMVVDLKDGVQYVLRFGGVAGISSEDVEESGDGSEEIAQAGAERYLLVTTRVNESQIPKPALQAVPQSLDELAALRNPTPEAGLVTPNPLSPPSNEPSEPSNAENPAEENPPAGEAGTAETPPTDQPAESGSEGADAGDQPAEATPETKPQDGSSDGQPADGGDEGTVEASGQGTTESSGEGTGSGGGQDPNQPPAEEPSSEQPPAEEPTGDDPQAGDTPTEDAPAEQPPAEEPPADQPAAEETGSEQPPAEEPTGDQESAESQPAGDEAEAEDATAADAQPANEWDDMTPEEQQEYLQAEQEKIKKENQRLLDQWQEEIDAAKARVRDLNARFADWYYIVPESTYANLQIRLEDLTQSAEEAAAQPPANPGNAARRPGMEFGLPGALGPGN